MNNHPDVLIIGGGVIGLTTAWYLAHEGLRVEILDKGRIGQEASWAGAGILPPGNPACACNPFEMLRAHSAALFPALSAQLYETTRIDNGFFRCGGLEFINNACTTEEWRGEGVSFETVNEQDLNCLETELAPGLGNAYHLAELAQLRNPRHLKALIAGCLVRGVRLVSGCPAIRLHTKQQRVQSVSTAMGKKTAGQYLITAGAWSDMLLSHMHHSIGVRPVRGQIVLLQTERPLFRRVLLPGSQYLVPRPDGRVLAGSTEEDVGFNKQTTAQAICDLLQLATRLVPALADAHLERCWAGLRPGSPDGLPILGQVPDYENLFIATGHFRSGIQLSPGTALVMKQLMLKQPLTMPLDAFSIQRF